MDKPLKGRILIVDDDVHALQAFERILKNALYEVFIAKNGQEALNLIGSEKVHLVLLDVVLPDISGFEVLEKIKSNPITSSIFVVLISGTINSTDNQSEGLELGADGFLSKPIQNRELIARVDAFMRHKNTIDQLKESEKKHVELKTELEQKVIQRTNEIDIQLQKLSKSQKAMLYMVEDLNLVSSELKEEREKLENSIKELEAFSYSVSHDLRAPLRHITGFIRLFLEQKTTQLNSHELDLLNTVSNSADDMGKLIDALLSFSRLNRADLQKISFNSSQMIQQILDFYNQEIKARSIEITIKNLPDSYGDSQLITQVWTNLISNAIKYTSKKEKAIIEIGGYVENNETIFYIKDNGAGFDMKYADKLFGVFQRLHKVRDFEGIGIGLANIKRIVIRHGGSCWANGIIDQGAEFYFSLPQK